MAEALVSSFAEGILEKAGSAVFDEICLWWGANNELEELKNTVDTVKGVLLDAEEQSSNNNQVEVWLGQLKLAFYEADDLLDDFSTEASRRKLMRLDSSCCAFFSLIWNQIVYGIKMAHRVRDITQRLNKIAERRSNFHLDERPPERSVVTSERETHSSPPAEVVGREDDKRVIMDYLLSGDCEDGVGYISIVGIGGLGKTTLAQSVFNHEKVKESFEPKLWVCVSDNFDLKVIIGRILGQEQSKDLNQLKDDLFEKINGKRYLLVLDDVWSDDSEKWSRLTGLLVGGSRGSRVIVTTRLQSVADRTRTIVVHASSHEMKGLSETESWSLLKQTARLEGDDRREIGMEILEKCCGVPLAIRVIGGLLSNKSVAEWRAFKDEEIMRIQDSSILPILGISYNHLPSHLKKCFVYCRLFPKDSIIDVPRLIDYWIAQGFVEASDATQFPMDVGLKYFMELSWRSFFQQVEKDRRGNISFCKMHDLIHDLATNLAGVESRMFNSVGDYSVDGRTLHASFMFDPDTPWNLPASLHKAGNLRTLLPYGQKRETEGSQWDVIISNFRQWDVIISNFRRLRILKVNIPKIPDSISKLKHIPKIPGSISKLKHLRHLDLSNNPIEVLPDSITKLSNLLTLMLDFCSNLKQLPRKTKNLVNLSQLSLKGCSGLTHMPQGMGQLTSLHKLSIFVVAKNSSTTKHAGTLKELGKLNNLRGKLEITNLGHVREATEFQEANLKEKQHLQELTLDWEVGNNYEDVEGMALEALQPHLNLKVLTVSYYKGSKIPRWLSFLVNLVELRLEGCFEWRHLPPMHKLCNLKGLYISNLKSLEYIDNEPTTESAIEGRGESTSTTSTSSFFPSLETLELWDCPNLEGWWRTTPTQPPRFPCLSKLEIRSCPKMTSMPLFPPLKAVSFGPGSVISLKKILNISTAPTEECTSSSSAPSTFSLALSELRKLFIIKIKDMESLPEDLAQNLHFLKTLSIHSCHGLKTLGQALQHLTSLEKLNIGDCGNLNMFDEAMHWQTLRSLRSLDILEIPTLECFPSWFQQAMPSLQRLVISDCPNLKCLPKWMCQLPSPQTLIIRQCPQLSERFGSNEGGSNKGADWPNMLPSLTSQSTTELFSRMATAYAFIDGNNFL